MILPVTHPSFARYGSVLKEDVSALTQYLIGSTPVPAAGNVYVPEDPIMTALPQAGLMEERYFGFLPMQAGYCNGRNTLLNCMEWHGSAEIDIAGNKLALLLGRQEDMAKNTFPSELAQAFFLRPGEAVLLYPGTLHFSPCALGDGFFRCAVLLPRGTNLDLPTAQEANCAAAKAENACAAHDQSARSLLFKVNKWLIAHPDAPQVQKGAVPGISGPNYPISHYL